MADPSQPYGGGDAATTTAAPATAADPDAVNRTLGYLAGQYGGMPVAEPIDETWKDPFSTTGPAPTGNKVYTFPNGTTAVVGPNGQLGTITPAKEPRAPTSIEEQKTTLGQITIGNQTYVPNPDNPSGPWILSQQSQQTQALANQKTAAETTLTNAQARAAELKNALDADPKNAQLQQQELQARADLQTAQTNKTNIDAQIAGQMQPLNAADLAAKTGLTNAQAQQVLQQTQIAGQLQPLNAADLAAKTGLTNAQAQAALQTIAINAANAPLTQAKTTAETAYTTAQTTALQQKMGEPTVLQTGTAPTYTYWDPAQQKMVTAQNPAYTPTDPGRMAVQLQQQAQAQQQTLQQQVATGKLTPDQASSQFDAWWSQNIEPMKGDIAQLQATQQADLQAKQAQAQYYQAQAANLPATLAQTASDQAQKNALALLPYMGGASFAQGIQQINAGQKLSPQQIIQNSTFSMPNLAEIGRQGAAAALAHLSPTAQANLQQPGGPAQPAVGGPPDITSLLNRGSYGFGFAPAAAGGATQAGQAAPAQPVVSGPGVSGANVAYNPINTSLMPGGNNPYVGTPQPNFAAMSIGDPSRLMGTYVPGGGF